MATYTNLLTHLVFSTKDRVPFITPEIRPRLHAYLGGAVRGEGGIAYDVGGTADHVHLLIRWKPKGDIADLLREIKSGSSKWIHENFRSARTFSWQRGYGAFSVSHSQKNLVAAYIQNQEVHHAKFDFQKEFRDMLIANEIEFDEQYVWD